MIVQGLFKEQRADMTNEKRNHQIQPKHKQIVIPNSERTKTDMDGNAMNNRDQRSNDDYYC